MTIEKLRVVLNKMDTTLLGYLEILNKKELISFEKLVETRDLFKKDCFEIYHNGFEKEYLENLNRQNEIQLIKIQDFIMNEIFRLSYNEKWNVY